MGVRETAETAGPHQRAGRWRTPGTVAGALGRHWLFVLLLVAGAVLRAMSWWAYHPAILFLDSFRYVTNVDELRVDGLNPIGYTLFLKPLLALGGMHLVTAVQHLLGLAIALAVYVLALRFGARSWLAALAAAPVLLDAYQIQIEQLIMTDVLFEALLVAVLWACISRGAPSVWRMLLAGLVIGLAVITRSVAITLVAPVLVYAVVIGSQWRHRGGWKIVGTRALGLLGALALVLGGHAAIAYAQTGKATITSQNGNVLYGRTAQLADCDRLNLAEHLRVMCPDEPPAERPGTDLLAHRDNDPQWPPEIPPGETKQSMMSDFGYAVLKEQPWDIAKVIGYDFVKGFSPVRTTLDKDPSVKRWQFQEYYPFWMRVTYVNDTLVRYGGERASFDRDLASPLRSYQLNGGYTPGPLLAVALILGVLGMFGVRSRHAGMRSVIFLVTGIAFTVLFSAAMFEFSWRYQLPGPVLLPLAAVLTITAMTGPRRRPTPAGSRLLRWRRRPRSVHDETRTDQAART